MTLKQTIEGHPVVVYIGAVLVGFVAGLGVYDGILRLSGRSTGPTIAAVKVQLDSVTVRQNGECGKVNSLVTERFQLLFEGDPGVFIMSQGNTYAAMEVRKLNDGIFRADPGRAGWVVSYCAGPGWKSEHFRRFYNTSTGASSALILVKVEV